MISHMWNLGEKKGSVEVENRIVVTRGWEKMERKGNKRLIDG